MLFTSCWYRYRNNSGALAVWTHSDTVSIPSSNDADTEEMFDRANDLAKNLPFLFTSPKSDDYIIKVKSSPRYCIIEACLKDAPEQSVCLRTTFKTDNFKFIYENANYKIESITMNFEDFKKFVSFINQLKPNLPRLGLYGW